MLAMGLVQAGLPHKTFAGPFDTLWVRAGCWDASRQAVRKAWSRVFYAPEQSPRLPANSLTQTIGRLNLDACPVGWEKLSFRTGSFPDLRRIMVEYGK